MKASKHWMTALGLIAACITMVMVGACASGPATLSEPAPLLNQVDIMTLSYELGNLKPAPEDTKPLGNTKWQVTSINPKPEKAYASMAFFFQPDGSLLETTTYPDGSVKNETFKYRIIGSTMIINKPKEDVNARFRIEGGNQLAIDTGEAGYLLRLTN